MNDLVIKEKVEVISSTKVFDKQINVYGTFENPLFLAKDVAQWIELSNVSDMISRVDEDEVTKLNLGGLQGECNFLTENGLYEVLMQSRKPIAKSFKKEVKKILKEIRTKGSYDARMPKNYLEALKALVIAEEEKQKALEVIEEQKPKVEYFNELIDRGNNLNFRDTAKLLDIKEKTFIFALIDNRFIYRDAKGKLRPIAQYVGKYFELKEWTKGETSGCQTLITVEGREKFRNLIDKLRNH